MMENFLSLAIKRTIRWFGSNAGSIVLLIGIFILFFIISGLVIVFGSREFVINRWSEFRCDPFYSTFAKFYGKDPEETSKICGQSGFGSMLSGKLNPFAQVTEMINGTLGDLGNVFEDLDSFGLGMVSFISGLAEKFVETIKNIMGTALFLFMKLKSILGKIYGIFTACLYAMYSGVMALESLAKGPIGDFVGGGGNIQNAGGGPGGTKNWASIWMDVMNNGGGGQKFSQETRQKLESAPSMDQACCFTRGTPVAVIKHGVKQWSEIERIDIGDHLALGGEVLGIYQFLIKKKMMRNIQGVVVSGSHLLYQQGGSKSIRVEDVEGSVQLFPEDDSPILVYCVLAENHKMIVAGKNGSELVFADFLEYSDPVYLFALKNRVDRFYQITEGTKDGTEGGADSLWDVEMMDVNSYACGWDETTPVKVFDDSTQQWIKTIIGKIQVGDTIEGNRVVTGKIFELNVNNCYQWNEMILSGDMLVLVGEKYCRVSSLKDSVPVGPRILCCLATSDGIVQIGTQTFRDYWEVDDPDFWDKCESLEQKRLGIQLGF